MTMYLPGKMKSRLRRFAGASFIVASLLLSCLQAACSSHEKEVAEAITERDSMPVMDTRGVMSLISDSGVTRYRLKAEEWLVFDRKLPSYWAFEKGVYVEKFDSIFQVEASIEADTAYYYDKKKLWKLIGHVHVRNLKGEKFDTELLYWDQNMRKVYSDKRVRIEQPDQIIYAWGFESSEDMSHYRFFKTDGIFYVDEASADTLQTDSIQTDTEAEPAS